MMVVGFLGCYGAIQESQCLLGTVSPGHPSFPTTSSTTELFLQGQGLVQCICTGTHSGLGVDAVTYYGEGVRRIPETIHLCLLLTPRTISD